MNPLDFFKQPQASNPSPPPPAPAPPSTDVAANAATQKKLRAGDAGGYSSTILTSGAGDTTEAPVYKKTLLGA